MNNVLVTGPSGFLGYHVIKHLNKKGICPRVLLPSNVDGNSPAVNELRKLKIEEVTGDVEDRASLISAVKGIDTLLHLNFTIKTGGGADAESALDAVNVVGTRNVLDAAAGASVRQVVVSSSVLAVGISPTQDALNESADWTKNAFNLPYALSRRKAELEAMARPKSDNLPRVVVVNPSFTMGPDDYVGAPANGLARKMTSRWFLLSAPIGFGILDVRDYADGVIKAAEKGRHGQRYILSGENTTSNKLMREIDSIQGTTRWPLRIPLYAWILSPIISLLGFWSRLRGKPPKVTKDLLQLWGRNAWYDTSLARKELDWKPRPLRETIRDSLGLVAKT